MLCVPMLLNGLHTEHVATKRSAPLVSLASASFVRIDVAVSASPSPTSFLSPRSSFLFFFLSSFFIFFIGRARLNLGILFLG